MRNETRRAYDQYCARIAQLSGVPLSTTKVAVDPTVQQTLETKIQESSEFLKRINNIGVREQSGQKIGLGIGSTIAGTTDTSKQERAPTDPTTLDAQGYFCTQTNFDTSLSYAKLDAWAKFPDFQARVRDELAKRQALDIICIGFHGKARAATSDRAKNPLLEDVNIGWLEKIRQNAPKRAMSGIKVGKATGNDYQTLDAVVYDLVNDLIEPWFRDDPGLVAVMGRKLLADKYFPLVNDASQRPTDTLAADLIISQKRMGGLQAVAVPYFPDGAIMVTRLDNLSRYFQEGARRRQLLDNPKRDRIENYESSNDAYVVEDYGMCALVEGITLTDEAANQPGATV
ncbi:MAG: phage major capsid protein, P2 family [Zoogloeaceae bacterium]|jgi:P2 family phage major capsid protein|nr:phage major capsid protein, P2 family [Zoogloeaceae bacterium]